MIPRPIEKPHGWILQLPKWRMLWKLLDGFKWLSVDFVAGDKKYVPDKPGIYMLCAIPPECPEQLRDLRLGEEPVVLRNVMYIGEAKDLRQRFGQHVGTDKSTKLMSPLKRCFGAELIFCCAPTEGVDKRGRLGIEALMQQCFRPGAVSPIPRKEVPDVFVGQVKKARSAYLNQPKRRKT